MKLGGRTDPLDPDQVQYQDKIQVHQDSNAMKVRMAGIMLALPIDHLSRVRDRVNGVLDADEEG